MKKKILVLDDSPQVLEIIVAVLNDAGYDASAALNFEEVVRKAQANRPDLVLTDVVMPDVSGFDVCSKIRDMFQPNPPKIIVMTGKLDAIDPVRARKAGADDFVVKSTGMGALLGSVKTLLD
jgi:DNA-binding response OmpR family regulator